MSRDSAHADRVEPLDSREFSAPSGQSSLTPKVQTGSLAVTAEGSAKILACVSDSRSSKIEIKLFSDGTSWSWTPESRSLDSKVHHIGLGARSLSLCTKKRPGRTATARTRGSLSLPSLGEDGFLRS